MPTHFDGIRNIKPVAPDLLVSAGGPATSTAQVPVSAGGSPVPPPPDAGGPSFFDKLVKALPQIGQGLQLIGAGVTDIERRKGPGGGRSARLQLQYKQLGDQFQLEFQRKKNEFKQEIAIKKTNSDSLARWRTAQMVSNFYKSYFSTGR